MWYLAIKSHDGEVSFSKHETIEGVRTVLYGTDFSGGGSFTCSYETELTPLERDEFEYSLENQRDSSWGI